MLSLWRFLCLSLLFLSVPHSIALPLSGSGHPSPSSPEQSSTSESTSGINGINVPNPSISFGVPFTRMFKAPVMRRFRKIQRRSPAPGDSNPQPPATADAVQPHKAPVPDSAVEALVDGNQRQNQSSANPTQEVSHGTPYGDETTNKSDAELVYVPGDLAHSLDNIIQDMASSSSAKPSSAKYSKHGTQMTNEDMDPHSLSHSLGVISHSQFEIEDSGKKKRDSVPSPVGTDHRNQTTNTTEEEQVPTIWNGKVPIDDLNYWEGEELDKDLESWKFALQHAKQPLNGTAYRKGRTTKFFNGTMTQNSTDLVNSGSQPSASDFPVPKSIAKTFGLITHVLFRDKSPRDKGHRGHRRNGVHMASPEYAPPEAKKAEYLESLHFTQPGQDNSPKITRDEGDDSPDVIGTVDIGDEAYEEFRKQNPKYFGGGRKKERGVPITADQERGKHIRESASPSWLAMLFSPSALLEKRPVSKASRMLKRDSEPHYVAVVTRQEPAPRGDWPANDDAWFDAAFDQAWDDLHGKDK